MKLAFAFRFCLCLSLAASLLSLALPPQPARAGAVFNVACGDTAGLITAINAANNESANPGQDTIVLASRCITPFTFSAPYVANPAYSLAVPTITSSIKITGNGSILERSGAPLTPAFRMFSVIAGTELILDSVTLRNFRENYGPAVANYGKVVITRSTFIGNSSITSGGAVVNYGEMLIENSTFSENHTDGNGGALANEKLASTLGWLTLINVTITNNSAANGSALYSSGDGAYNIINSSTIANNQAAPGKAGFGIFPETGTVTLLSNTLLASNAGGNCSIYMNVSNMGGNLQWPNGSCGGSIPVENPMLLALASNGGPVKTMAIGPDSPAREIGERMHCPATDARGISRPQPSGSSAPCDSGAYESDNARFFATWVRFEPAKVFIGQPTVFKFWISNLYTANLTDISVQIWLPESSSITGPAVKMGSCSSVLFAPVGTRKIMFDTAILPLGQTCGFEVPVTFWKAGTFSVEDGIIDTGMTPESDVDRSSTLTVIPYRLFLPVLIGK
jgi:hypothetical protein